MCGRKMVEAWHIQLSLDKAPQTYQPGYPENPLPGQWFPLQWTYIPTTDRSVQATCKWKDGMFRM